MNKVWFVVSLLAFSVFLLGCGDDAAGPGMTMPEAGAPDATMAPDADAGSMSPDATAMDATVMDATVMDATVMDATMSPPDATATEALPTGVTMLSFDQMIEGERVTREVLLHVPERLGASVMYPIVFALHGAGGSNERWVRALGDEVTAGRFVGVYPQGHNRRWNINDTAETMADDVAFIEMIVEHLMRYRNLDHTRRFVMGTSNGGGMSHKLAVETTLFKAITAIVTQLSRGNEPTTMSGTVGVLQVLGMEDRLIPYGGGSGPMMLDFHPAETSAELWATHNVCTLPGARTTTAEGNVRIEYTGCTDGVRVLHYGIAGAGHGIPGTTEGGLYELALGFFEATP